MAGRIQGFKDRRDAGRQLAGALHFLQGQASLVLALPRGGVPVGFEIAHALGAPLDLLFVRKISAPHAPEFGIGAVVEGDPPLRVLNRKLLEFIHPPPQYLALEERRQLDLIARRRHVYCGSRKRMSARGQTVLVVDDGIATGSTMRAALQGLAQEQPARLLFAVPVAAADTFAELHAEADEGICLLMPEDFQAVSMYYEDFEQTTDEEVIALFRAATASAPPAGNRADPARSNRRG